MVAVKVAVFFADRWYTVSMTTVVADKILNRGERETLSDRMPDVFGVQAMATDILSIYDGKKATICVQACLHELYKALETTKPRFYGDLKEKRAVLKVLRRWKTSPLENIL